MNADGYLSTGTGLGGFNMYAYCNNNPVIYTDSEGTRPFPGTTVSDESAEERSISCQHMMPTSIAVASKASASNTNNTNNDVLYDIYNYVNSFCHTLIYKSQLTAGCGIGYGGSVDLGETSIEAAAYFNPFNMLIAYDSIKCYSSIYIGGHISYRRFEKGPEYHLIFDWSTLSFENVSKDFDRLADIEYGISYYKKMGGQIAWSCE